ncbi:MAG: hypothetical protein K2H33_00115 [Muribaculaceae bacterium]|nr:hypothetical protein [Muribaculaceae bacterium]
MKSKRDLKKQIRYICGDIVGECMLIGEISTPEKQDEVAQLIVDTAVLQESTISKISFSFDKCRADFADAKAYRQARSQYYRAAFSKLHDEFNTVVRELVHRMNELAGLAKQD